jgi:hypothetical protein
MGDPVTTLLMQLRYRLRQAGGQGICGGALLLAAIALVPFAAYPQWRHLESLQRDIAQLRIDMPKRQAQWVDRSPQASLDAFYAFLPAERSTHEVLSMIFSQATAHAIEPQKAEYRLMRSMDAQFSRYQITLPVRGDYIAIRKFVIGVQNALPAAALNEITFKRTEAGSQPVEASIRWTVFLRQDGS